MRGGVSGALRDRRGFSMLELLLAATIFAVVAAALTGVFLSTQQAFDRSASQAYVQRQATLIQERIVRLAQNAVAVQVLDCGPNGATNGTALVLLDANGTVRCVYQSTTSADTDGDLMLCQLASFASGTACTGGTIENMLTLMGSEVAVRLGAQLKVRNTIFSRVTCVQPGGSCSPNAVGRSVLSPLIDVTFDITDGTIYNPNYNGGAFSATNFLGMRYGFSVTARN